MPAGRRVRRHGRQQWQTINVIPSNSPRSRCPPFQPRIRNPIRLVWRSFSDRRRDKMKNETVAVHGGYETDPATKAVAVPIYQTVAYEFDSADHGAALFNLEAEGHRYSRISNPTTEVLERRVAALEGGVEALCVSSGQAALHYAVANVTDFGCNIVLVSPALPPPPTAVW